MIEIDGSQGEGGGQVLRSSLALSILTGQSMQIIKIRSRRPKPGLQPQHLKSVDAAAAVCRAQVEGAAIGSGSLVFEPGELRSGRYRFEVGTAGSTSLVLQTIFLPLSLAKSASSVIITGGTHVPHAPSFHYLDIQWLPWLRLAGFDAQINLERAGFYPQGAGRILANIRPAGNLQPLKTGLRGERKIIQGISAVANLDTSIAERQKRQAVRRLESRGMAARIKITNISALFKGTMLLLLGGYETQETDRKVQRQTASRPDLAAPPLQGCYYGLGELGKPAERVADEAVDSLLAFLESEADLDQYLADQLLLPLSCAAGESEFRTCEITQHLVTNAAVIQAFAPVQIEIDGELGRPGRVRIQSPGIVPARERDDT